MGGQLISGCNALRGGTMLRASSVALGVALLTSACLPLKFDVGVLSHDALGGRDNGTPGAVIAQDFLIARLAEISEGLAPGSGVDAFKQPIDGGVNLVGIIPGGELADEFVVVGGHYDHVGTQCAAPGAEDQICNGATDNAAGAAAVLAVGRSIVRQGTPKRSVVLALWDREEDGLRGSAHYVANPLVPLADTVAYINFDIQGANILPSLRRVTFAIGSESGGAAFGAEVTRAADGGGLQTERLSSIFGQFRSDYINFINAGIPTVFFSDSTGPCYHTPGDEYDVVDFGKLQSQVRTARRLVTRLAFRTARPTFAADAPVATYDDAVALDRVASLAIADLDRFTPEQQVTLQAFADDLGAIVEAGRDAFSVEQAGTVLARTAAVVALLTNGECDGFLAPPTQ